MTELEELLWLAQEPCRPKEAPSHLQLDKHLWGLPETHLQSSTQGKISWLSESLFKVMCIQGTIWLIMSPYLPGHPLNRGHHWDHRDWVNRIPAAGDAGYAQSLLQHSSFLPIWSFQTLPFQWHVSSFSYPADRDTALLYKNSLTKIICFLTTAVKLYIYFFKSLQKVTWLPFYFPFQCKLPRAWLS